MSEFYSSPSVQVAVRHFIHSGGSYYDVAFDREDVKQEAAISFWLSNSPTSTTVYRDIVDAARSKTINKRNGGLRFAVVSDEKLVNLVGSTTDSFQFWHDLNVLIESNKARHPKLERFILAYFVDGMSIYHTMRKIKTTMVETYELLDVAESVFRESAS